MQKSLIVEMRANLQPEAQKWSDIEIRFLLRFYPQYKNGDRNMTSSTLRSHLKSRTMSAISKKYWSIMGSDRKEKIDIHQLQFNFLYKGIAHDKSK